MNCGRSCGRPVNRAGLFLALVAWIPLGPSTEIRGHRDGISFWLVERDRQGLTSVLMVPKEEIEHLFDASAHAAPGGQPLDLRARFMDAFRISGPRLKLVSAQGPDSLPTGYLRLQTRYETSGDGELLLESLLAAKSGGHRILGRFIQGSRESPFVLTADQPSHRLEIRGSERSRRTALLWAGLAPVAFLTVLLILRRRGFPSRWRTFLGRRAATESPLRRG
jgi:hypothetical protein